MPLPFTYGVRLQRLLCRKSRSREDAEDLIQEGLLRLHVYGSAAGVANEEALLRRIVTNLAVDQYRRAPPDTRTQISLDQWDVQSRDGYNRWDERWPCRQ